MDRFFSNLGVSPSLLHIAGMLTLYSFTIIYEYANQLQDIHTQAWMRRETTMLELLLSYVGELRRQ